MNGYRTENKKRTEMVYQYFLFSPQMQATAFNLQTDKNIEMKNWK